MTEIAEEPEVVEVDAKGNVIEPEAFKRKSGRGRVDNQSEFSEELLASCRDIGIEEYAIRDGGDYRQYVTEKKRTVYWLPLPELLEFEQADAEITDDQKFWAFFKKMIEAKKLQTKGERTGKKARSWNDDWKHNFDWAPKKVSQWWSDWGYNSSGYGSGDSALTKKLALALKAVNTTVSVINDTGKRFVVRLASEADGQGPTSYTSFDEKRVVVSPGALLDTSVDTDRGIEVTTGYALHEGSHIKYTMSLLSALTQPTELTPLSVSSLMHNILEDLRIELLTGERFPGFRDYFGTANAYLWGITKDKVPTTWGPDLKDKTNAVIGMAKWPNEYEAIAKADPQLAEQWPWWREWANNYTEGKEPIRMGVIRALERLAEDPQTKKQMDDLAKQEQELKNLQRRPVNDKEFGELLKELKKMLDNGIDPCPSPGQNGKNPATGKSIEIELTAQQAKELDRLLNEQYSTHEATYKMKEGQDNLQPLIESERPLESPHSRASYHRPGPMVERLRSVFYFRKKRASDTERLLKQGLVDEEQLWRAGANDPRVFERTTQPEETYTSVTLLVDASGSMNGRGLNKAQELANVMMACLRTQRGVTTRVRAHTTGADPAGGASCKMYRIWEPGDPDTRIGLIQAIPHGSNFDGFAIDWCARELESNAQAGESKLLIVLSDGLPAGTFNDDTRGMVHYGGTPAMRHMMELNTQWERRGVHIVQIAIDHEGIRPEQQAQMFPHWIGYENDAKLLRDMTALLAKTFGAEDN